VRPFKFIQLFKINNVAASFLFYVGIMSHYINQKGKERSIKAVYVILIQLIKVYINSKRESEIDLDYQRICRLRYHYILTSISLLNTFDGHF